MIADAAGKLGSAFAAGKASVFDAIAKPKALQGVESGLAKQIAQMKGLYESGAISAEAFGQRAAAATVIAADKAKLLGEQMALQEVAAKKTAAGFAALGSAFNIASGALRGFVRGGLAGTTAGEALALRMQLVSREVASLFLPAIQAAERGLNALLDRFRALSGEQQENIGKWLALGVGALGVAAVLPKLTAGLQGVGAAFSLLAANPFAAALVGIALLLTATEEGRGALGGLLEAVRPLGEALGGLGRALAPLVTALAETLPPLIEALKPAFEGVAFVVTKILQAVTWVVERVRDLLVTLGVLRDSALVSAGAVSGVAQGGRSGGRHELANATRGPEALQASFTRFQTAALRTSAGTPERHLRVAEEQTGLLRGINQALGQPAPPSVA